jgi:secondary thiamine-phosphate synthase enzyme
MRQAARQLDIPTRGRGFHDVTSDVRGWAEGQGMATGLLTLFCRHTSASLLIQENADPDVLRDLETWFETAVPEDPSRYRHADEGPDDMPAHIRTALTGVQLSIPLFGGRLALGTWQGVYLFEHRRAPHRRMVAMHLLGA